MSQRRVRVTVAVLSLFLVSLICTTLPTTAQEIGAGAMQSEDPKNLTYEQNTMYLYGEDNGGSQNTWEMWTHSANTDGTSDSTVGEGNAVGDPNNGAGSREFVWEGSNPPSEVVPIDSSVPITGAVKLQIICNWEQNQCSKQVNIVLRLGNRDIAQVSIDMPDEDDYYYFEFYHQIEEVPADETFGLRLSFQKPGGLGDGYNLDLGRDNSWMVIPVKEPYQEQVPGLDNTDGYTSPYEDASGYKVESTNTSSWLGLIFWCLFSIGIFVGGFALLPPIPFKEISILMTGMGLLGAMFVAPLISGPVMTGTAANPDDPNIWTIEELAQLEERDGTFLGDEMVEDYEFQIYAEYNEIYTAKDGSETISALGFESDSEILGDPEISRRGREYVQLYFSLYHMDLRPGQAILVDMMIVNSTNPITGESSLVPLHACPDCTEPESGHSIYNPITITVDGQDSVRYPIPHQLCELFGEDFTWQYYPVLVSAVGLLLGGFGFWQVYKTERPESEDEGDYDEDFEDALDDLEEF